MGHGLKECKDCSIELKDFVDDYLSYSLALRAESKVMGKESLFFGLMEKKIYAASCVY